MKGSNESGTLHGGASVVFASVFASTERRVFGIEASVVRVEVPKIDLLLVLTSVCLNSQNNRRTLRKRLKDSASHTSSVIVSSRRRRASNVRSSAARSPLSFRQYSSSRASSTSVAAI